MVNSTKTLIGILLCILCCASLVFSAGVKGDQPDAKQVPLIITSATLTADNEENTATFEGNVIARKGETTLYADRMIVFTKKDLQAAGEGGQFAPGSEPQKTAKAKTPSEQGAGDVDRIEAYGNVRLIKGPKVVTAAQAIYYTQPEEYVVFRGDPRAAEGRNVVTGSKMTYYMKDDRSVVENSKVFLIDQARTGKPSAPAKQ
jgi:lipopolysaccharide export system protein LptA